MQNNVLTLHTRSGFAISISRTSKCWEPSFQALHKLSNGSDTRLIKFELIQSQITKSLTRITKHNLEVRQQSLSADANKRRGLCTCFLQPNMWETTKLFSFCVASRALPASLYNHVLSSRAVRHAGPPHQVRKSDFTCKSYQRKTAH